MVTIHEDNLFAIIIKGSLVLVLILSIGALTFFSRETGLGVLAGGFIAIANFAWMRNTLQRILGSVPAHAGRQAFIRYIGRMTVTGVALYFVLTSEHFALSGVLIGLSIIVLNILILTFCRINGSGG